TPSPTRVSPLPVVAYIPDPSRPAEAAPVGLTDGSVTAGRLTALLCHRNDAYSTPSVTLARDTDYPAESGEVRTVSDPDPIDHRKGPRRRGDVLYSAIFEATLDELTDVGYAELRMERIASRARASKGSLYGRWSSRAELWAD